MINYTLTRSKRKTTALYVRDGVVEVRAPFKIPKRDIDLFVASKEDWIRKKMAAFATQAALREHFRLDYNDSIMYRGKPYPVVKRNGTRSGFDGEHFFLPPDLTSESIKAACVQLYRLLAKRDLTQRTSHYAKRMSVMPVAVKINGAKTRWGSCSARKSINFSWRLIMADDEVVDYVVVHELAHLSEMNHSARFWAIVEGVLPDFRERRSRLRLLQQRLASEDW